MAEETKAEYAAESRKEYNNHLDQVVDKFEKHVSKETEQNVILLKGHLLIEYYLNQIMVLLVKGAYKKIKNPNFGFFEKIVEVNKLNLFNEAVISSLKALNRVRNEMSHELEFNLSESHLDSIGFPWGEDYILLKLKDGNKAQKDILIGLLIRLLIRVARPVGNFIVEEKVKAKFPGSILNKPPSEAES